MPRVADGLAQAEFFREMEVDAVRRFARHLDGVDDVVGPHASRTALATREVGAVMVVAVLVDVPVQVRPCPDS